MQPQLPRLFDTRVCGEVGRLAERNRQLTNRIRTQYHPTHGSQLDPNDADLGIAEAFRSLAPWPLACHVLSGLAVCKAPRDKRACLSAMCQTVMRTSIRLTGFPTKRPTIECPFLTANWFSAIGVGGEGGRGGCVYARLGVCDFGHQPAESRVDPALHAGVYGGRDYGRRRVLVVAI